MPPTFPTSNYWLKKEGTGVAVPYRTPTCHTDFPVFGVQPRPLGRRLAASFAGLVGNRNAIVDRVIGLTDVYLENAARALTLRSPFYTDASLAGGADAKLIAMPGGAPANTDLAFSLPLTCTDGVVGEDVWAGNTNLVLLVDTAGTLAFTLRFSLVSAGGTAVHKDRTYLQLAARWLDRAHVGAPGVVRFVIPFADLLAAVLEGATVGAGAANSPYKLQVSVLRENLRSAVAWTYFHVPYKSEVQVLESHATQRVLFKRANMPDFAGFGALTRSLADDDAIAAFVATPPPPDRPMSDAEAHLYLTSDERETVQAMLIARTLAERQLDNQQRLLALATDKSPPEIVVRKRRDVENQRENLARLDTLVTRVTETHANIAQHDVRATLSNLADYDQNTMNILVERAGGYFVHLGWGVVTVFRRHAGTGRYWLARLYIAAYGKRTLSVLDRQGNLASFAPVGGVLRPNSDDDPTAVRQANSVVPVREVIEGDFTHLGEPARGRCEWAVFEFAEQQFPLASVVTYGVSACSASTFFTNEDEPEAVVFSHLDGDVYPPYRSVVAALYDGANPHGAPASNDLRAINFMIAELDEVEKYSKRVLFPDDIAPRTYESVLCPREGNLWGFRAGQVPRGYDATGVGFPVGAAPTLIGAYGLRSHPRNALVNKSGQAQGTPATARKVLFDFQRNIYGTLPTTAADYDVDDVAEFQKFLREAHTQVQTSEAMKSAEEGTAYHTLRKEVLSQRTVFRLNGVGRALYTQVSTHGSCKPLAESDFVATDNGSLDWLEHR